MQPNLRPSTSNRPKTGSGPVPLPPLTGAKDAGEAEAPPVDAANSSPPQLSKNASSQQLPGPGLSKNASSQQLPAPGLSKNASSQQLPAPMGLVWTQSDLIDVCEKGVGKSMHHINKIMLKAVSNELKEVRGEMQAASEAFRTELQGSLSFFGEEHQTSMAKIRAHFEGELSSILAEVRQTSLAGQLEHVRNDVQVLMNNQRDLHTECSTIIAKQNQMLEQQRDAQTSQEDKVVRNLQDVRGIVNQVTDVLGNVQRRQEDELQRIQTMTHTESNIEAEQQKFMGQEEEHWRQYDQLAREQGEHIVGIGEAVKHMGDQMDGMLKMQQSLSAELEGKGQHLKQIEQESRMFKDGLESQLSKYLQEKPVNVDFTDLSGKFNDTRKSVHSEIGTVLGEIGRIQKAMNMDFVVDASKYHARKGTRVREVAMQTDRSVLEQDAGMQTEVIETKDRQIQTGDVVHHGAKKPKKRGKDGPNAVSANSIRRLTQNYQGGVMEARSHKQMFADAEAMKQRARDALLKPPFNVANYYHRSGCSQTIAKSSRFENLTFVMIGLNAVWIAIDIDYNDAALITEAHPVFIVAEYIFCTYFALEIGIRFMAFRYKRDCMKDWWFIFDGVLVVLMVIETWVLSIVLTILDADSSNIGFLSNLSVLRLVRLVKLIRMARLAKLLRAVPELVILLKGILTASRSVSMVFVLWLIIIYFYAMIFRQITKGEDVGEEYFDSVLASMNTLLLNGILPESASIVHTLAGDNPLLWPIMMSFIILASLTVANMLIGVLVGVVGAVADTEKEGMIVSRLASEMRHVYLVEGRDLNAPLLKEDFQHLLVTPSCACAATEVGVDVVAMLDMTEMVYDDMHAEEGLTFEDFVNLVLSMRGANPATVKDIKEQGKVFKAIMKEALSGMTDKFDRILEGLQLVDSRVNELRAGLQDEDESDGDYGGSESYVGSDSFGQPTRSGSMKSMSSVNLLTQTLSSPRRKRNSLEPI